MSSRIEKKASARERAAQVRAQQLRAERRRRIAFAGGAVVLVVALVAALVIAKLSGAGSGSTKPTGQASSKLLSSLDLPATAFDSVGTGTANGGPKAISAPDLTKDGKPQVLYIGAEYCPYCAAERWAIATALARFGTFTGLGTTHSSSSDVDPNTPTLSFHNAKYNSDVLTFTGVETTTNKQTVTGYQKLDTPSAADQKTFDTYNKPPYVSGQGGAIPFVDIGGKFVSSGATYDPGLLAGKTQQEVADALKDPSSDISKAVLGSANLFTAAICSTTGDKPTAVCTSSGVKAAAAKLGEELSVAESHAPSRPRVPALELTGLVLAVAGLLVSAYLTYEHFTSSTTLACPETGTVNCAKVTTSQWSTFVGIPVALLGLLFYVVMVVLMTPNRRLPRQAVRRTRLALAAGGVCFALYLVWAELFRINAICLWCTGVHAITLVLFCVLAFDLAMGEEI